ncbi:phage GP46 family protein [Xenorhabdus bovienii]|uniref:Phage GP46 family protein n=1 Tax=Xenorhabdus bovienii TaxID=40576 RepID=A0AAJ1N3U8_XENBV|nr:phage GP46 family protein [Xenorhabdus bovienii]MDE1478646.1 phage GP46 family protein [Xenorhabdus bovienii]MDE1492969.1 phage GP46 family protein [Xenorhabdus bovienii]MDE9510577.1 phage GP46 family protein [Xenorhabdus bovienii]MDE9522174.1 phage GP46 family protein [Xenorhabdus bovienii]
MSDITSWWDVKSIHADWRIGRGDLVTGDDLQTAMIISLFTDRQARSDDDIDGVDRRGWWGDSGADYSIGSRLWLLHRQKLTTAVALAAEDYAREALQWMLDDGVAESIDIRTQIVWPNRLNMIIRYQRPGRDNEDVRFFWVWERDNAV